MTAEHQALTIHSTTWHQFVAYALEHGAELREIEDPQGNRLRYLFREHLGESRLVTLPKHFDEDRVMGPSCCYNAVMKLGIKPIPVTNF